MNNIKKNGCTYNDCWCIWFLITATRNHIPEMRVFMPDETGEIIDFHGLLMKLRPEIEIIRNK